MTTRRQFLMAAIAAQVRAEDDSIAFRRNGRLLFQYRFASSLAKPYVHPLCAPSGRVMTLDSPPDHVHHHGLMLAWSDVNGYDFWGETNPAPHGRIVHHRVRRRRANPPELATLNHWVAEGRVLLVERRMLRAPAVTPDAVWLEWESELAAASDPVILAAEKHVYNGLGIRFPREMDRGRVLNSAGATEVKQADGQPAQWCAYWATPGGASCGLAIFDHPGNPRHPSAFFVMNEPFGYLSAAPTYREPFRIEPGRRLVLRWAVVAFDGPAETARLAGWYRRWTGGRTA
ncbi:MAG: PmoA family protein [Bryobacteraceae bacterium]